MKGGLVVRLAALQALAQTPGASALGWEILVSNDEETGSHGSRRASSKPPRVARSRSCSSRRGRRVRSCYPAGARAASPPRAAVAPPMPRRSQAPVATRSWRSPSFSSRPPSVPPNSPGPRQRGRYPRQRGQYPRRQCRDQRRARLCPVPARRPHQARRRPRTAPRPPSRSRRRDPCPRRFPVATHRKFQSATARVWSG
jgi:hypothetical protein